MYDIKLLNQILTDFSHYLANEGVIFSELSEGDMYEACKEFEEIQLLCDIQTLREYALGHLRAFNQNALPKILKQYILPVRI
jgi:hypothetical protein